MATTGVAMEAKARRRREPAGTTYVLEPDYSRGQRSLPVAKLASVERRLELLYGPETAREMLPELRRILKVHLAHKTAWGEEEARSFVAAERFSEKDVVLITYGDLIRSPGVSPLESLESFAEVFFKDLITIIHILPFYPYSSDRGFSVISYTEVDPRLGSWEDIRRLGESFRLMFDGVFNHMSSQSEWFREFINGHPEYRDYFIAFSSASSLDDDHLKIILRPRTSSLLTRYDTMDGERFVWTTFSADQVDLNFRNPKVLLRVLSILLAYVRNGAQLIRLDAITYLWFELGTSCAHLRETHECIKLMRDVLDIAAPEVALVSETNVPHADNISYFGNGEDEAQMVYNFALPCLVLHTILAADATVLSRWAADLEYPSDTATFFNFLDSHDGIGVMGARGILDEEQILWLAREVEDRGGFVSMKANGDGSESPYELNITWFSALNPDGAGEGQDLQVDRFLASRAIALALRGVPGIYLPSLVGTKNDLHGVFRQGGTRRDINRAVIDEPELMRQFSDPESLTHLIYLRFRKLLESRAAQPAFHPLARQVVVDLGPAFFAVLRLPAGGGDAVLAVVNVRATTEVATLGGEALRLAVGRGGDCKLPERTVLSLESLLGEGELLEVGRERRLSLGPYGVYWGRLRTDVDGDKIDNGDTLESSHIGR